MENPMTWGKAERIVSEVLMDFHENQDKPITDPTKVFFGPSLEMLITNALRKAGLLKDEHS